MLFQKCTECEFVSNMQNIVWHLKHFQASKRILQHFFKGSAENDCFFVSSTPVAVALCGMINIFMKKSHKCNFCDNGTRQMQVGAICFICFSDSVFDLIELYVFAFVFVQFFVYVVESFCGGKFCVTNVMVLKCSHANQKLLN